MEILGEEKLFEARIVAEQVRNAILSINETDPEYFQKVSAIVADKNEQLQKSKCPIKLKVTSEMGSLIISYVEYGYVKGKKK